MTDEALRALLGPLPLADEARVRRVVRRALVAERARLLEGVVYGGFALATVAWTFGAVVG